MRIFSFTRLKCGKNILKLAAPDRGWFILRKMGRKAAETFCLAGQLSGFTGIAATAPGYSYQGATVSVPAWNDAWPECNLFSFPAHPRPFLFAVRLPVDNVFRPWR